jgi:hypothetical protein
MQHNRIAPSRRRLVAGVGLDGGVAANADIDASNRPILAAVTDEHGG